MTTAYQRRANLRRMTIMAMLVAIVFILTYTPLGYLQLGPIAATLIHLPVLIGLMAEGLGVGLGMGLVFGLSSMLRAYTMPTVTSFIFMNPVVALVPRLLVPLVAWGIMRLVQMAPWKSPRKQMVAWAAGSFVGTLVNTVGVLGLIYLLYAAPYAQVLGIEVGAVGITLLGVGLSNGIPEAIIAMLVVPAVVSALSRLNKRARR